MQTSCDGRTGLMLCLKLVKTAIQQEEDHDPDQPHDVNHGTQVLLDLVSSWFNSDPVVCADSYFSSVQTAMKLKDHNTKYIVVVKTAAKQCPMTYLA
jgi:Transposase IS4